MEGPIPWKSATQFALVLCGTVIGVSNVGGLAIGVVSLEPAYRAHQARSLTNTPRMQLNYGWFYVPLYAFITFVFVLPLLHLQVAIAQYSRLNVVAMFAAIMPATAFVSSSLLPLKREMSLQVGVLNTCWTLYLSGVYISEIALQPIVVCEFL